MSRWISLPDRLAHRQIGRQLAQGLGGLALVVAEREQGLAHVVRDAGRFAAGDRPGEHRLALELEQQAFGGFLADAGHLDDAADFLRGDRHRQVVDRQAGQHRKRGLGADAGDFEQFAKRRALGLAAEAVKQMGVLADRQVGEQADLLAERGQVVEGAHRHVDFVADAVHVHQHLRRLFGGENAADTSDHLARPVIEKLQSLQG
jgi:hypothetical protein